MASSAQDHHHLQVPYGTTTAPPPTPTTQSNPFSSSSDAADVLSSLLHRLPPTLSLPTRRSKACSSAAALSPPTISLSPENPNLHSDLLFSSRQTGFFQVTDHSVPRQLAQSAKSESLSFFDLPREEKLLCFPRNWPLGFDFDEDEEEDDNSLCLDSSCSAESTELSLGSLREFTCEMERVGLEVIDALARALGFGSPVRDDPTRVCSLVWISDSSPASKRGRIYPYIVGLQYQIRCQKYSLQADSGSVSVLPEIDSVLVTLGDIAKVWSNGKIKHVRGRPLPILEDGKEDCGITISILVTLPIDSTVSPLPPLREKPGEEEDDIGDGDGRREKEGEGVFKFSSFCFEDYAWRVYHERLLLKDRLDRYRI